jgi:Na+:H+ antiporter, NhaA family
MEQESPIDKILRPFEKFARLESSGGILLLCCTVAALVWANSPYSHEYVELWETHFRVGIGRFTLDESLHHWINDGLMAIFFFVVGLEIKREMLEGELASPRKAALPMMAALGGMVLPAIFYFALNVGGEGVGGWGIPMATDIAFALGILALLGNRIPVSLKIFLTALAIVDDMGAVLVIAFFYTSSISWISLMLAGFFLLLMIVVNLSGVRRPIVYGIFGVVVWLAFLKSGIHATIAGVLCAMTVPHKPAITTAGFMAKGQNILDRFKEAEDYGITPGINEEQQAAVHALEAACEQSQTPLMRMEHALHPLVAFLIMPIFALANAGVTLSAGSSQSILHPVSLGIIMGLVIGKQVGITFFSWLAARSGIASIPEGISMRMIYGVSWLGGIGFTMSLFIAGLAFETSQLLSIAKLAILVGSSIAGIVGYLMLRSSPS